MIDVVVYFHLNYEKIVGYEIFLIIAVEPEPIRVPFSEVAIAETTRQ